MERRTPIVCTASSSVNVIFYSLIRCIISYTSNPSEINQNVYFNDLNRPFHGFSMVSMGVSEPHVTTMVRANKRFC